MPGWFILVLIPMLASMFVSWRFRKKAHHYSQRALSSGMSGKDIAEKMLQDNGIFDVKVISVEGHLSDHYNPQNKTVNLSPDVYSGRSVLAAAVAAHECGHAVQHAKAYAWLQFRSAMVPVLSITSNWVMWVLLGGVLMINIFPALIWIGIGMFAFTTLFSFVTLPVEFDASRRALVWLDSTGITRSREHEDAKGALRWAASTYVIAALASLGTLLYYVMIAMGRRE
ncbi:zinc metallopeptidase [Anseongella ginsenosidimutans]|nr:zinc metallopeptidase [Anseongella ginsenosidimutans]